MLDVLLKSKFHSKCKTLMKLTKMRIEMIKRKRSAMEKFLKKDIVDLIKNGLDINAYGRSEGLLIELNVSACYNLVAQFCVCLLHQVSKMDKQRVCPEDCREAVASLMYAAARFADLPELRELRAIFVEKYGNSFEANVSHEFVEKLKAAPPTKEMKILLLQAIAKESGKSWDSKGLEQKLFTSPVSDQALCDDTNDENHAMLKNKDEPLKKITKKDTENNTRKSFHSPPNRIKDLPSYRTRKNNEDRDKFQENEKNAVHGGDSKTVVSSFNINPHVNGLNSESDGRKVELDEKKPLQRKFSPAPYNKSSGERKYEPQANENHAFHGGESRTEVRSFNNNKHVNELNVQSDGQKAEVNEKKPFQRRFAPAPYNKRSGGEGIYEHQANGNNTRHIGEFGKAPSNIGEKSLNKDEHQNYTDDMRSYQRKFNSVSYQESSEKTSSRDYQVASLEQKDNQNKFNPIRNEHNEKTDEKKQYEGKFAPPAPYTSLKAVASLIEEKTHQQEDSAVDNAKPKPRSVRSVRSRRSIVPPDDANITNNDDVLDAIRQELAIKPGHKSMNNRKEVDEKDINKILMHYCKKESPRRGKGLQL